MTLSKRKARQGYEQFYDIFLEWEHNGKFYKVRVLPAFKTDYRKLLAHATEKV